MELVRNLKITTQQILESFHGPINFSEQCLHPFTHKAILNVMKVSNKIKTDNLNQNITPVKEIKRIMILNTEEQN